MIGLVGMADRYVAEGIDNVVIGEDPVGGDEVLFELAPNRCAASLPEARGTALLIRTSASKGQCRFHDSAVHFCQPLQS
jgi:hypothetical protein